MTLRTPAVADRTPAERDRVSALLRRNGVQRATVFVGAIVRSYSFATDVDAMRS